MVTAAAPSYSHATEPRAVANRSKFRAPEGADGQSSNIMFDRRVVRGSTYAQPIDTPVRLLRQAPPCRTTHGGCNRGFASCRPPAVCVRRRPRLGPQARKRRRRRRRLRRCPGALRQAAGPTPSAAPPPFGPRTKHPICCFR